TRHCIVHPCSQEEGAPHLANLTGWEVAAEIRRRSAIHLRGGTMKTRHQGISRVRSVLGIAIVLFASGLGARGASATVWVAYPLSLGNQPVTGLDINPFGFFMAGAIAAANGATTAVRGDLLPLLQGGQILLASVGGANATAYSVSAQGNLGGSANN